MATKPQSEFGRPDDLSPEWTEYETLWSVLVSDFDSPLEAAKFLARRRKIFATAATSGITKEMLAHFSPNKPGFESRVKVAFEDLLKVAKSVSPHAAE